MPFYHLPPPHLARSTHLVEIKHQIQFTNVSEKLIQHFDKEMDRLQVCEFVVVGVYACAKEQTGVAAVDYFGGAAEFYEIGLVFLVAGGHETVDLEGWM